MNRPDMPAGAPLGAGVTPASEPPQPPPAHAARGRGPGAQALLLIIVIAVVVLAAVSLGGHRSHHSASTTATRHTTTTAATKTTARRTGGPHALATLALSPPSAHSKATGMALVVRRDGALAVVIDAHGLAANAAHNAYAVWLYDGAGRSWLVGLVPTAVGPGGALQTDNKLPRSAALYSRLLLTLETRRAPTHPGRVVLSGPFRER